jgi:enhancing lycopene biosynthesis protein 2
MEISARNTKLMELINDVAGDMADLAKWPDSEATKTTADNKIKLLKKAFHESGYPNGFIYLSMIQIAANAYGEAISRDIKPSGLKIAWLKIGELLY